MSGEPDSPSTPSSSSSGMSDCGGPMVQSNTLARNAFPYKQVIALLICWEDEEDGVWGQVTRLKNVFEDKYRFTTDILRLPAKDPECFIIFELEKWRKRILDQESLLVVYYSGHGSLKFNVNGHPSLRWYLYGDNPLWTIPRKQIGVPSWVTNISLGWDLVARGLLRLDNDVLVLMDTCEAAAALGQPITKSFKKRMDVIAACGYAETACGPRPQTFKFRGGCTFTDILTDTLEHKARETDIFTAANLYAGIVSKMIDRKFDTRDAMPMPVYFPLGNDALASSIPLRVLVQERAAAKLHDGMQPVQNQNVKDDGTKLEKTQVAENPRMWWIWEKGQGLMIETEDLELAEAFFDKCKDLPMNCKSILRLRKRETATVADDLEILASNLRADDEGAEEEKEAEESQETNFESMSSDGVEEE